jgi:tetratricopeptide (TPR) repeat protein
MNDNLKYFSGKWKGFAEASENGYRITLTRQQQLGLLLQWGEERFSQGDMHAAIKIFKRVLLLDRKNSQALNNLGVIQWQLGDMPASLDTFQVALRINPEDSDALGNLVQGVIETERFDLLQQDLLDTLRQKHPAHPDVVRLFTAQQNAAGAT